MLDGVKIGFGMFIVLPLLILLGILFLASGVDTFMVALALILVAYSINIAIKKFRNKNTK